MGGNDKKFKEKGAVESAIVGRQNSETSCILKVILNTSAGQSGCCQCHVDF